jgi:hypothetical protein
VSRRGVRARALLALRARVFGVFGVFVLVARPLTAQAAPPDWLLAHPDVETTGLIPGHHELIDFGMVITDSDGVELDRLFLRTQPEHPERTSPEARAVNAFDAARWRAMGALSPSAAVDSRTAFHRRVAGTRPTMLVAFNSTSRLTPVH